MQKRHDAQHIAKERYDERKFFFDLRHRLSGDNVDVARKDEIARVEPDKHVGEEYDHCGLGIVRLRKEFDQVRKLVRDVMKESNDATDRPHIVVVHARIKIECHNMMQSHLDKASTPLLKPVNDQSARVITHCPQ